MAISRIQTLTVEQQSLLGNWCSSLQICTYKTVLMSSILLAESGSTKTDWCLLAKGKKPVHFKTAGINPYLQSAEDIHKMLTDELAWNKKKHHADTIAYYGAG